MTPTDAPPQTQQNGQPPAGSLAAPQQSGFGSRGRARRRARFLRKARELAYRDLGGLVFNLHRFGARNDELVLAKLTTVGQIDAELRTLEGALGEREPVTVLREAGINACPRCAAIHSSEDRFCPNCGLSMGRHADLPIAGAAAPSTTSTPATTPAPATPASAPIAAPPAVSALTPPPQPAPSTAATDPAAGPSAPTAAQTPAPPATAAHTAAPADMLAPDPTPPATAVHAASPAAARRPSFTSKTPPSAQDTPAEPASAALSGADSEQPTEIIHPEPPGP